MALIVGSRTARIDPPQRITLAEKYDAQVAWMREKGIDGGIVSQAGEQTRARMQHGGTVRKTRRPKLN